MVMDDFDRIDQDGHNPTVYGSWAEMKAVEKGLPFSDPPEPEPHCCGNCDEYNGIYCTKYWNNLDECYKDKDRDSKEPDDTCEDWSGEYGFSCSDF